MFNVFDLKCLLTSTEINKWCKVMFIVHFMSFTWIVHISYITEGQTNLTIHLKTCKVANTNKVTSHIRQVSSQFSFHLHFGACSFWTLAAPILSTSVTIS